MIPGSRRALPDSLYALIWRRTCRWQVAVIAVGLALPPLAVVPLDLQRRIVDEAIPRADLAALGRLAAAYVAAAALAAVVKFAVYWLRGLIEAKATRFLRDAALGAQQRRAPAEARAALGPVAAVVAEEAHPLGGFAAQAINIPLIEGGALIGVAGFMLAAEPWLAAIGLAGLAAQAIAVPTVQRFVNRLSRRRVKAVRRATTALIGASERRAGARFRDATRAVRGAYRLRLRMNLLKAGLKAGLRLGDNLAIILVLGIGGAMVARGETTLGVIVAFLAGLRRLREPWDALIDFYREFADAHVKYRLLRAALAPGPRDPAPAAGDRA